MLLRIQHRIDYTYSQPVVLEPHTIRLRPRSDSFQTLTDYSLTIFPDPAGTSEIIDLDATASQRAWFLGEYDTLSISVVSAVKIAERMPFDFIVYPFSSLHLPMKYSQPIEQQLQNELQQLTANANIFEYAELTAREVQSDTLRFLTHLAKKISDEFIYTFRETGEPYPPEITFDSKKGSCRDLSIVYMAICRHMGLASRFVSGYFYDPDMTDHHLHAWVEVYIPGGGWRGFDPTNGVAVEGKHVVVATSAVPSLTTPVAGTYRGDATQQLSTEVQMFVI